jgi:anti-sigma-K factor RskA
MTHPELRDMLGLYALGALEGEDAAALEAHLRDCRTCLEELGDLQEAAAELARAARPISPSVEVTRRILDATRSEPQLAAVRPPAERPPGRVRAPLRLGVPRPRRRLLPVAARIAVAAVIVVLVVSQIDLLRRLDRALSMLARGRELIEFIASPEVTTVPLVATEAMPGGRAFVAYGRRSGRVVLFAFNLPRPPADQVYQLWVIAEGVRPGLVFSPDARGATLLHDQWSPEQRQPPLFAITLEPSTGAREPTGEILLLGGLPRARPDVRR